MMIPPWPHCNIGLGEAVYMSQVGSAGSALRGLPVHALWREHPGGAGRWRLDVPALPLAQW